MAASPDKERSPDAPRRPPIVRGAPLVLFAALQVALVAASFSDTLTVSGEPEPVDVRSTLTWVAVGSAAYLFVIWPLFLFATERSSQRPWWKTPLEGLCLVALAVPALIVSKSFSNAPAARVWVVGGHLLCLAVLMTGLGVLARRVPAAGRWVLTAAQTLGLGLPVLVYFLTDFASGPGALWAFSPPLTAASLAGGTLSVDSAAGMLTAFGAAVVGGIAAGVGLLIVRTQDGEPVKT